MKRFLSFIPLALTMAVFVTGPAAADKYTFGNFMPPKHPGNTIGTAPYFATLKKQSGGSLDWKLMAGGQLFSAKATLASVGKGIADGGFAIPSYTRSDLPNYFTITDLHIFGDDVLSSSAAVLKTGFFDCPECKADWRKNGTVLIGGYSPGIYNLVCNSVVKTIADVKGKRIRTSGATARWAKALGGVPRSMTVSDIPEALQRKAIDCYAGPVAWVQTYKLYGAVKSVLKYPMGLYKGGGWVVNAKAWDKMGTDNRKLMLKAMPKTIAATMIKGYVDADVIAFKKLKEAGAVITPGGADMAALMAAHRKKDALLAVNSAKKRGVKDPQKIIDSVLGNIAAFDKKVAASGRSIDAYARLLWDEIYSKLDADKI